MKKNVMDISISVKHSAFVIGGGYVLTFGDNSEGQLGVGHKKDILLQPVVAKKISERFIHVSLLKSFEDVDVMGPLKVIKIFNR